MLGDFDGYNGDKNLSPNAEQTGYNNGAYCSRKGTRQSDGWTSSEDEAEETEEDEEGNVRLSFGVSNNNHYLFFIFYCNHYFLYLLALERILVLMINFSYQ